MGEPDRVLLALTATELEVLEVAHLSGLLDHRPGPTADGATGERWVEAIRSLSARGLLAADGTIASGTVAGQLAETVLDVRLGATAVVVLERVLGHPDQGRDLRLLHLLPVGAVVEDVHPDGFHGFDVVLHAGAAVRALTDAVVPADAADGPSEAVPVVVAPEDAAQLPARLGGPTVLAELTLVVPEGPVEGHLVALGPTGCWAAPRRPGPLRFVPVPVTWVAEVVRTWVDHERDRAVP